MPISSAFAQTTGGPAGMGMETILLLVGMFAFMYFMIIRPQTKRAKEHKQLMGSLQKGDEVLTAGGILGKIAKVDEGYIALEIAPNTEIKVQKGSVQTLLPKGTIKSAG